MAGGQLKLEEGNTGNYAGFEAPTSLAGDVIWKLPAADGDPGQALVTDGSLGLSWADTTPASSPLAPIAEQIESGNYSLSTGWATVGTNFNVSVTLGTKYIIWITSKTVVNTGSTFYLEQELIVDASPLVASNTKYYVGRTEFTGGSKIASIFTEILWTPISTGSRQLNFRAKYVGSPIGSQTLVGDNGDITLDRGVQVYTEDNITNNIYAALLLKDSLAAGGGFLSSNPYTEADTVVRKNFELTF